MPWCVTSMKCLLQVYSDKIRKSKSEDQKKKLRIKTLMCLARYFEHNAPEAIGTREWEFLKMLCISIKEKHNQTLDQLVNLRMWQT